MRAGILPHTWVVLTPNQRWENAIASSLARKQQTLERKIAWYLHGRGLHRSCYHGKENS